MEPPQDQIRQATKLLFDAALSGDSTKLKQALQQGAEIDNKTLYDDAMTSLHCAASRGHTEVVEALLAHGADINGKEQYQTPLFTAALNRERRVVQLLLSHGASISMPEGSKPANTKLINAVIEGSIQKVIEACSDGADPNAQDYDASSALHWACISGRADLVLFLLKQGANPRVVDGEGNTPLHYAALGGYYCCAHYLLRKGAEVDRKNKADDTPLHYAASCGQERVAELLCNNGASVHVRNCKGDTPLHDASLRGKISVVMLLLAKKSEVNARNNNMMMPLHGAACFGHCNVAEALLNYGAKIDAPSGPNNHWYLALNYATMNGHYPVVKLLLERNTSEKLAYKRSNLFFSALSSGNCDLIHYFFDRGVRLDLNYPFVENGIVKKHHLKAVRLLLSHGANIGRALAHVLYVHPKDNVPSESDIYSFVSVVLEYGANVMDVLKDGQTCALLAARYEYKKILTMLVTYGAPLAEIESHVIYDPRDIFWATAFGDCQAVQKIVTEAALADEALKEAFIIAATQGHRECLECLFSALEKKNGWENCVYQAMTFIQRIIRSSSLTPEQKSYYDTIKNLLFSYSMHRPSESPEGRIKRALAFIESILRRPFLRGQRDDYRIMHAVLQAPLIRPESVVNHARELISRITHLTKNQEERINYWHLAALLGLGHSTHSLKNSLTEPIP
jgi:ankyrin repeat protein